MIASDGSHLSLGGNAFGSKPWTSQSERVSSGTRNSQSVPGLGRAGREYFHYPASLGIEVKWKFLPSASGTEGSVRQDKTGFLLLVKKLQQSLAVKIRCSNGSLEGLG